jgi:hypothetical protein
MPIDYNKGKIYKIISLNDDSLVYYGSTCQRLSKRLSGHKTKHIQYQKGKGDYVTSFKVFDAENVKIYLVEDCPCENKEQLHAREGYYIRNNECVNKCIPGRGYKQYYQDNKEKHKKYRDDHKEKNKIYWKEHRLRNKEKLSKTYECECGSIGQLVSKNRHERSKKHQSYIANCA